MSREFTLRKGIYKGKHVIYDSLDEAEKNGIIIVKDPWWDPDVKAGDWVQADDGYIVQCLNRYQLTNKRHKNGQYTDCFMFPQGLFYVYYDKKGEPNIKTFYGALTKTRRSQLGESPSYGKYMNSKKKLFVTLIAGGQNPYVAYAIAFNKNTSPPQIITKRVNELLADNDIREELMEALKPFAIQIENRILELTQAKYTNLNEFFIDKTARLLTRENKSPTAELAILQFGLKFLGRQLSLVTAPESSSHNIQEAEYKIVPPPKLGSFNQQQS